MIGRTAQTCTCMVLLSTVWMLLTNGLAAEIKVVPETTYPGSMIRLIGSGLPPGQPYYVHLDGRYLDHGVSAANGTIQKVVSLDRMLSLGIHTLNLSCGPVFALASITVIQWPAKLGVSPNVTRAGNNINISGVGFPPDAAYWIYLDGQELLPGATGGDGTFWRAFTLPKDIPLGPHTLTVNATQYTGPPSARCAFYVEQWPVYIAAVPARTQPGTWITIEGGDLPPFSLYKIFFDDQCLLTAQAELDGIFKIRYRIPENATLGNHSVSTKVIDYFGTPSSKFTLEVVQWPVRLSVDPPRARTGEPVTIQGCGFPPRSLYRVYLDEEEIRFGETNAAGEFNISYGLPRTLSIGAHQLVAIAPSYSGPPTASADMEIRQWAVAVQVSPKNPHPGSTILIRGTGYPPLSYCYAYLDSEQILVAQTTQDGTILAPWDLCKNISLGTHNVSVVAINYAGLPAATDWFEATQWPLAVYTSSTNLSQGSVLGLRGSGFPPLATVRVYWDGIERIKAGTTGPDGIMLLEAVIPYPDDEAYHELLVNVSDYTGPPQVWTYVWLGRSPPSPTIQTGDSRGQSRSRFFVEEPVYVKGSELPPLIKPSVLILDSLPQPGVELAPVALAEVSTDQEGRIPWTLVWVPDKEGEFWVLLDVNCNGILDDSDLFFGEVIGVSKRPDVAVLKVTASKEYAVQGEGIDVLVAVSNEGPSQQSFGLSVRVNSLLIWAGRTSSLAPGANETLCLNLKTSTIEVGLHSLVAEAERLDNETDLADNVAMGPLAILRRPDIEVRSVVPDKQVMRVGEVLRVQIVVRNLGQRPESFNVSLLLDSSKVVTEAVPRLQAGSDLALELLWDSSSQVQGNFTLSAVVDPLPLERETKNNVLTYGTLVLLRPNVPPVADPGGPYGGAYAADILFNASGSFDPDGSIVSYEWDFGDGQTGHGLLVRHAYATAGTFVVVLKVTDNDRAWSAQSTVCTIGLPTHNVRIRVIDSAARTRLTDVSLRIDDWNFTLAEGYAEIRLPEGNHSLSALRQGFAPTSLGISLGAPMVLELGLVPLCYAWTSDSGGRERNVFKGDETVFITISSPGNYSARAYVVIDGDLPNGAPLVDVTGAGYVPLQIGPGVAVFPLWRPPLAEGRFDAVVDLDANGILNTAYDLVHAVRIPGFVVAEDGPLLAVLVVWTAGSAGALAGRKTARLH